VPDIRTTPKYTTCRASVGTPRHSTFIRELGKCRVCGETKLYEGLREGVLEELSTALLRVYVVNVDEAVWGIDDIFWERVTAIVDEEIGDKITEDEELEVDYDTEGLRIIHEALLRAAGKIEANINSAGEDL
jgi:hypothetical protein